MTTATEILHDAARVLIVDWPSRDVPETLAFAGYTVFVKGGPGPQDYSAFEVAHGEAVSRGIGRAPERVDLVYCHRPLEELPGIVDAARQLGAKAIWRQSGLSGPGTREPSGCWLSPEDSRQGRVIAEAAGLSYIDDVYIADAVRELGIAN